jgi:hypothetical protein
MAVINVEIRAKHRCKSNVFSISNLLHGTVCALKKCQRTSTEETLGYRTVSTVLSANSDLNSYQRNTQSLNVQIRRGWLVRERTNQVRFDFFLTFSILLLDSEKNWSIRTTPDRRIVFKQRYDAVLLEKLYFQ